MKLLTKEIEKLLPKRYSQENEENPKIITKYFHPLSSWTWYVIGGERDPDGDMLFFGLVDGQEKEFGYFTLRQLEEVKIKGLGVERDLYFGYDHRLDEFKKHAYKPDKESFDLFIEYTLANPGKKLTYESYLEFKKEKKEKEKKGITHFNRNNLDASIVQGNFVNKKEY